MLQSLPLLTGEAAKEGSRWIPFLGIPIAASISYTFITSFLTSTLDSLSVDAESVLIKALDISALITGYSVAVSNE